MSELPLAFAALNIGCAGGFFGGLVALSIAVRFVQVLQRRDR